jgi:hypothetical protein
VGAETPVITTVSVEDVQGGLLIVHTNLLMPIPKPVNVLVGLEGVVIVPLPLDKVQVPVPTDGAFPANVALVPHID